MTGENLFQYGDCDHNWTVTCCPKAKSFMIKNLSPKTSYFCLYQKVYQEFITLAKKNIEKVQNFRLIKQKNKIIAEWDPYVGSGKR